jgi:hypothetical protein
VYVWDGGDDMKMREDDAKVMENDTKARDEYGEQLAKDP